MPAFPPSCAQCGEELASPSVQVNSTEAVHERCYVDWLLFEALKTWRCQYPPKVGDVVYRDRDESRFLHGKVLAVGRLRASVKWTQCWCANYGVVQCYDIDRLVVDGRPGPERLRNIE